MRACEKSKPNPTAKTHPIPTDVVKYPGALDDVGEEEVRLNAGLAVHGAVQEQLWLVTMATNSVVNHPSVYAGRRTRLMRAFRAYRALQVDDTEVPAAT